MSNSWMETSGFSNSGIVGCEIDPVFNFFLHNVVFFCKNNFILCLNLWYFLTNNNKKKENGELHLFLQ